jgi:nucleoside-diphosphate-sugar epimerase
LKVLVTGASGFIGRRLASALARRGDRVVCLVRPTSDVRPLQALPIEFVQGDLGLPDSLGRAAAGADRVFHLAGTIQAADEAAFDSANVLGTRNLVEACLRAPARPGRFIFVSSIAAAGPSPAVNPLTEADEPRPVSAYGRSKLAAERLVLEAGAAMPVTIVRPPNVLGPGSKELEAAARLLRWGLTPSFGSAGTRTSLIDVDDLVAALLLAAESPLSAGQTYFVTDGHDYGWPEVAAAVAEAYGRPRFSVKVPFGLQLLAARLEEAAAGHSGRQPRLTREIVRAARDHSWVYDGSRIERELGFRAKYGLRESVRRAAEGSRPAGEGRAGREEGR